MISMENNTLEESNSLEFTKADKLKAGALSRPSHKIRVPPLVRKLGQTTA